MKITKGTIVRTILVITVALNIVLKAVGVNIISIDEGSVAAFVEAGVEVAAIICAWWYNNSFSERALQADKFFKSLKESNTNV